MPNLVVSGEKIRVDKDTGFICITDIANLNPNGRRNIENWLRNGNSVLFFEAWEISNNPSFNVREFAYVKNGMGSNNFHVYSKDLINAGCSGIFVRKGRYGGTYCDPDWAIHFANWIDPVFYVETIKAYRLFTEHFYGKDAQLKRFTRELAAENFKLISGTALKALPESADALFEKRIASVEADILNLALWGMTAQEWRIKHPQTDERKNMRDFATPEELKTMSSLQVLSQEMHENGFSSEERLDRLTQKAGELINHYCYSDTKKDLLGLTQHKRGWGKFIL
jgi:hypothetical protein